MKVLFIGPYRDGNSGWANACKNYILALDSVGVEVVPRSYKLNNDPENVPARILDLENGTEKGCDIVVHCGLPHLYSYSSGVKNVGIFFTETKNFSITPWVSHINLMDLGIVPSLYSQQAALNSGVKTPIKIVPPPVNLSKFKTYPEIEQLKTATDNDYLFYFIGDMNLRKNLPALIKAFHTEFTPNEPVSLVLKLNKYGMSPDQLYKETINVLENIRAGLRLRPMDRYKKEIVITDDYSDDELMCLHQTCDCFVSPSFGESWGMSCIDAMGMGNIVVASDTGAQRDYADLVVRSYDSPCYGIHDAFDFMFTGFENWDSVSVSELGKMMRFAMELKGGRDMNEFGYEAVGNKLKDVLIETN